MADSALITWRRRRQLVTERNLADLDHRRVSGACLVGAVVLAAGGPEMAGSQLVHRALRSGRTLRRCGTAPVRTLDAAQP